MSTKTAEEAGNLIIANYLGWEKEICEDKKGNDVAHWKIGNNWPHHSGKLVFNSDWNALLPVCKKLRHTEPPKGKDNFMKWEEKLEMMDLAVTQNYEISDCFPFVVDAIKFLTENK